MLDSISINDLDEIKKQRKESHVTLLIAMVATIILAYFNIMFLALASLIIAIGSHIDL